MGEEERWKDVKALSFCEQKKLAQRPTKKKKKKWRSFSLPLKRVPFPLTPRERDASCRHFNCTHGGDKPGIEILERFYHSQFLSNQLACSRAHYLPFVQEVALGTTCSRGWMSSASFLIKTEAQKRRRDSKRKSYQESEEGGGGDGGERMSRRKEEEKRNLQPLSSHLTFFATFSFGGGGIEKEPTRTYYGKPTGKARKRETKKD